MMSSRALDVSYAMVRGHIYSCDGLWFVVGIDVILVYPACSMCRQGLIPPEVTLLHHMYTRDDICNTSTTN